MININAKAQTGSCYADRKKGLDVQGEAEGGGEGEGGGGSM